MGWRTLGVVAATALAAATAATPAVADTQHWVVSALPTPPGLSQGYVTASDGHGGYAGLMETATGYSVVTWSNGRAVDHGTPAGEDFPSVLGESSNGTVLVAAGSATTTEVKLYTLDATGYHPVSTGLYTDVQTATIGPRGDMAVLAGNPAEPQSTVVLYWSPFGPAGPRPLAGALRNSSPLGIDDDGTVLLTDDTSPYLVRDGVARRLTVPANYKYPAAHAIRNGIVVGSAVPTDAPGPVGMVWTSSVATPLEKGAEAYGVNANGRVAGAEFQLAVPAGPAAVWQGTVFQAELPLLAGTTKATARLVDADGTIAGWASDHPLDEGGRPVVWRQV